MKDDVCERLGKALMRFNELKGCTVVGEGVFDRILEDAFYDIFNKMVTNTKYSYLMEMMSCRFVEENMSFIKACVQHYKEQIAIKLKQAEVDLGNIIMEAANEQM